MNIIGDEPIDYPGLVEHMKRQYPDWADDPIKLINCFLCMRMYNAAEYLARITYGVERQDPQP